MEIHQQISVHNCQKLKTVVKGEKIRNLDYVILTPETMKIETRALRVAGFKWY